VTYSAAEFRVQEETRNDM